MLKILLSWIKMNIIDSITSHRGNWSNLLSMQFLVKWSGYSPADDTWEPWSSLRRTIQLHDYLRLKTPRNTANLHSNKESYEAHVTTHTTLCDFRFSIFFSHSYFNSIQVPPFYMYTLRHFRFFFIFSLAYTK